MNNFLNLMTLGHKTWVGAFDAGEYVLNLIHVDTIPVDLLHKQWDDYFDTCEANNITPTCIQTCHSQGAILVRNALETYDPERRKKIHVVAVAPAAFISKKICGSIQHIVGKTDIVPYFDIIGRIKSSDTITRVDRHPDVKWYDLLDHSFQSPTYRKHIQGSIQKIINKHVVWNQ